MFILAQFINSLAIMLNMVFNIMYFLLVIRIILSWFGVHPYYTYNELLNVLYRITEPILAPFRRLPLQFGGIDFSPVLAFILLSFLNSFIVGTLRELASRIQ